jgi:integrase
VPGGRAKRKPGGGRASGAAGAALDKMSGWPDAVRTIGAAGLHFHDLRHTGNQFAANSGAALKDLMARMGHDSERAALTLPENTRRAGLTGGSRMRSTSTSRPSTARGDDEDGAAGTLVPAG